MQDMDEIARLADLIEAQKDRVEQAQLEVDRVITLVRTAESSLTTMQDRLRKLIEPLIGRTRGN